ncbi:DNA alkylation repair protein [Plantactinospora sp. B5E13]|uniref:DNA alkylation repair protein n=1 Tax=Plantactinospora sp. B5E13 TaxID=3153758 RepID=UPI00325C67C2
MPFADELIGAQTARALVSAVAAVAPQAPLSALRRAAGDLAGRSLRERSDLLGEALRRDLPGDYATFTRTIRAARDGALPFHGWLVWPVTEAVAAAAVADGTLTAFDDAMALLADLTSRLTAEFALRTLLHHDLDRALAIIRGWTDSPDPDVRRLASEGTRPFLPWAKRVPGILTDPRATLPILDALYRDESEYVRRSVANHLNDLSRQQPDIVAETARSWLAAPDENTDRVVRHGLRTLVKQGHPGALALLGFTASAPVEVVGPALAATEIPFGGSVGFTATITNTGTGPVTLAVDYIVHHRKANGSQRGKTFKLTTMILAPGEQRRLVREHSFRQITTRRYHPGAHAIELQVNGVASGRTEFTLLPDVDAARE